MTKETIILVDGANIEISAKELDVQRINYAKFKNVILEELKKIMGEEDISLVRPYYYDSWDGNPHHKTVLDKLESIGYDLQGVYRFTSKEKRSRKQKCVDIKIAVDMVHFADATPVSIVVLCSGDKDFLPAIEAVKYTSKKLVVVCFKHSGSEELIRKADIFIDLTPLIKKFKLS